MAIAPDTAIAVRRVEGGDRLRLANVDPARYPAASFSTDPAQAVDTAHHAWGNYFVCAYKGAFEWAASQGVGLEPAGLEVMVHGTVPLGECCGGVCASKKWGEREKGMGGWDGGERRERKKKGVFLLTTLSLSLPPSPSSNRLRPVLFGRPGVRVHAGHSGGARRDRVARGAFHFVCFSFHFPPAFPPSPLPPKKARACPPPRPWCARVPWRCAARTGWCPPKG